MEKEIIATIKSLALDMLSLGTNKETKLSFGMANLFYTLYTKHLNISTSDSKWINRDRFVLSASQATPLLYATLFLAGFDLSIEDLKQFSKMGSKTPSCPDIMTPGVDITTGLPGIGFASAVGLSLGEKIWQSKYQIPGKKFLERSRSLIDYNIYVLVEEEELETGIVHEAASFAGEMKLNNLIVLCAKSGSTTESVAGRFKAMGWNCETLKSDSSSAISKAITAAKTANQPTIIEIPLTDSSEKVLSFSKEEMTRKKNEWGVPTESFFYSDKVKQALKEEMAKRVDPIYRSFAEFYRHYAEEKLGGDYNQMKRLLDPVVSLDFIHANWQLDPELKESTLKTNQFLFQTIQASIPYLLGGGTNPLAFLPLSQTDSPFLSKGQYSGRWIPFGLRTGAMGAILNGLSLSKFSVIGSMPLIYADLAKTSLRMSAISKLPVIYLFTDDSLTSQLSGASFAPIEQLAMLRSIPNLNVYRPCDAHELIGCWDLILKEKNGPSALLLSKQEVNLLKTTNALYVTRGAYMIRQEVARLDGIFIATGGEVQTAYYLAEDLFRTSGVDLRVVSMPCKELFESQDPTYKNALLPKGYKVFVLEAGSSFGWYRFVSSQEYVIAIDQFSISGSKDEVLKHCQFDYATIRERILKMLR